MINEKKVEEDEETLLWLQGEQKPTKNDKILKRKTLSYAILTIIMLLLFNLIIVLSPASDLVLSYTGCEWKIQKFDQSNNVKLINQLKSDIRNSKVIQKLLKQENESLKVILEKCRSVLEKKYIIINLESNTRYLQTVFLIEEFMNEASPGVTFSELEKIVKELNKNNADFSIPDEKILKKFGINNCWGKNKNRIPFFIYTNNTKVINLKTPPKNSKIVIYFQSKG